MAHRDGRLVANELFDVAEPCGLTGDQIRSCLRRLVNDGQFERTGEGRAAVYRATDRGRDLLASIAQRHRLAYHHDHIGRGWDRLWHLAMFSIPETRRAERDQFRDRLIALGGAPVQPGVYLSPHHWEHDVTREAAELGIERYLSLSSADDLTVGGSRDPRQIAAGLWDLGEVATRYDAFVDSYEPIPEMLEAMRRRGERIDEDDFLPGALHIAIRFTQCFEVDPLLPPELLPRPWSGRRAREILAECRRLGMLTRAEPGGPALFEVFDDAVAALP